MNHRPTLFLKIAIFLIGTPVLALCLYGLVWFAQNPFNSDYAYTMYPILVGIYGSAIPFYIALYKAFELLSYIDQNKAFSQIFVTALQHIKYCAIIIGGLYTIVLPFVYLVARKDDAPGFVMIMGMTPIFASTVIAVFANVLQRLLQDAIDIKSENDLVV
ncbi:DUF2975 domain-containing protein [Thermoactinomyces sp. DSM 45892]|uniref:DUF2975 domain-containing protein n=1 Tax=Thermoactinomyces sp. DSM 45892 TaxID=1882753 RepID=UPI00089D4309|nr:DUF2975 domain-containing protein [Thermoactinomyces sp. DSM 45892]SDY52924.1 Protein of unknown function [Thermoactinomyces sp. DSM 45892]